MTDFTPVTSLDEFQEYCSLTSSAIMWKGDESNCYDVPLSFHLIEFSYDGLERINH